MGKLANSSSSRAERSMEDELRSGFQWEKSSGLEHSCFHCTTKSNSPRALQTCYGIHSVPCSRYHQTMHAVGMSHNCEACSNFERMEDGRHRQIAELIAEFRASNNEQQKNSTSASSAASPSLSKKGKTKKKGASANDGDGQQQQPAEITTPLGDKTANAMNSPVSSNTNSSTLADIENLTIRDPGNDNDNGNGNGSPATPATPTPSRPKMTKAALRATKRAARQAKSELKAVKNQTKHTVSVKSADVQFVADVLHGVMRWANSASGNHYGNGSATNPDKDEAEPEFEEEKDEEEDSHQDDDASTAGATGTGTGTASATTTSATTTEDEHAPPPRRTGPPSRHPLPTDTCIEDVLRRNVAYVKWIREHNAELLSSLPKQYHQQQKQRQNLYQQNATQKARKKASCVMGVAERRKCWDAAKKESAASSSYDVNGSGSGDTGSVNIKTKGKAKGGSATAGGGGSSSAKKKKQGFVVAEDYFDSDGYGWNGVAGDSNDLAVGNGLNVDDGAEINTATVDGHMDALVDAILMKLGVFDSGSGATTNSGGGGAVSTIAAAAANGVGVGVGVLGGSGFGSPSPSNGAGAAAAAAANAVLNINLTSAQTTILNRLRVEITDDLRKHETEQRMTCVRAGGFWNYAGKGVFDRMSMLGGEE